jgi:hypothetical protein
MLKNITWNSEPWEYLTTLNLNQHAMNSTVPAACLKRGSEVSKKNVSLC